MIRLALTVGEPAGTSGLKKFQRDVAEEAVALANRVGVHAMMVTLRVMRELGLTVEEELHISPIEGQVRREDIEQLHHALDDLDAAAGFRGGIRAGFRHGNLFVGTGLRIL